MAVKLNERIIDELPLTFEDAFRTSKAPIDENRATELSVIDNIRYVARVALLPLQQNLVPNLDRSYINSWYRSPAVNAAVKGVESSKHLTGGAVDISVEANYNSRQENARIFYFLWNYLTTNNIPFDELIWEVEDSGFAASPNSKKWPQWVHLAINRVGANRKKVKSVGVAMDFNVNNRVQGLSNEGNSQSVLTFSSVADRHTFDSYFRKSNLASNPDIAYKAKARQVAYTWFAYKERLQMDLVSSKTTELVLGGFMGLSGQRLVDHLNSIGETALADRISNVTALGAFSVEASAFRKDKFFLAELARVMGSRKSVEAQFNLFFNTLNETLFTHFPLMKEPFAHNMVMDNSFSGNDSTTMATKSQIQSLESDGAYIDYYSRTFENTPLNPELRRKYSNVLNTYFIAR